jgi:hypothetical protein
MVGSRLSASFFKTSQTFRNVLIADVPLSLLANPPAHKGTFPHSSALHNVDCSTVSMQRHALCSNTQTPSTSMPRAARHGVFTSLLQLRYPRSSHSSKPTPFDDTRIFFFFCHTVELDCQLALDETTPFSAVLLNDD